jgi:hypothetical protein
MYHRVRSSFVFGHGEDGPRAIVIRSRGDNSHKFNGESLFTKNHCTYLLILLRFFFLSFWNRVTLLRALTYDKICRPKEENNQFSNVTNILKIICFEWN